MSYKHLKDYIYYSELYDRMTINECEHWENGRGTAIENPKTDEEIKQQQKFLLTQIAIDLGLWFCKGDCYLKKEETIDKWMARDREKDEKLENAIEPKGMRCLYCSSPLSNCISRNFMTDSKGNEEVVFMFECDKCHKRRAYWENGNEWQLKPSLCPKCKNEMNSAHTKKDNGVETVYSCQKCSYKETDFMDFNKKKDDVDPDFEMKRKKYCLTEEEGRRYSSEKINVDQIVALSKKQKDEKENKKIFDDIGNIKILTIIELQNLLDPLIVKASYAKFEFEKPEIQKDVILGFSVQDTKSGRNDRESIYDLQRLLRATLKPTNWRLMSDGVSYRLGYLQGRLRGIEGEEKLRKLIENDILKKIKK